MDKGFEREQMFLEMLYEKNLLIKKLTEELQKLQEQIKEVKNGKEETKE